jgi:hypothetical protein
VLRGHARERAKRHTTSCPECAYAVAVQREAVWALRAAPAPALPTALIDRLRQVPLTTPIRTAPTALAEDGSTVFATFGTTSLGSNSMAAFVPAEIPRAGRSRHLRPFVITTAAVAAAGVLTVGSASAANGARLQDTHLESTVTRPASTDEVGSPAPQTPEESRLVATAVPAP